MEQKQSSAVEDIHEAMESFKEGRFKQAIAVMEQSCQRNPEDPSPHNVLSKIYSAVGANVLALRSMCQAVIHDPEDTQYQTDFGQLIRPLRFNQITEHTANIKEAVTICLSNIDVDNAPFYGAWESLLELGDEFVRLKDYDLDGDLAGLAPLLNNEFLLLGLKQLFIANVEYERLFTKLRRCFLFSDDYNPEDFLPFLCALAEQCGMNEYIYACTEEEREEVAELEKRKNPSLAQITLIGCYRALVELDAAADISRIAVSSKNTDFRDLIKIQVDNPLEVRKHHDDIPTLSPIKNTVSSSVAKQYEENPYPRWRSINKFDFPEEHKKKAKGKTILVAGCGTGQEPIGMAMKYPYAQVLGIDLSIPSLAYGRQKADAFGVDNVEFMHADILDLEKLDRQFDMITCGGVLHHMKDPAQGWRKLLECLKPDGAIKIALYSELARQSVVQCREWIKEQGFEATPEGIRDFRQAVMEMEVANPLRKIMDWADFFSMSMCRDLAFHVQEHRFTLPQVKSILDDLDLCLISLKIQNQAVQKEYLSVYPEDEALKNLDNWHEYETKNPETFMEMYSFWSNRKDSNAPGQRPEWH